MGLTWEGNIRTGPFIPISWASRHIRSVVRSTFAAETLACIEGIEEAIDVVNLLKEFFEDKRATKITIYS